MKLNSNDQRMSLSYIHELLGDTNIDQAELASYGTLTAAEFVWSWASIDPQLIHATDFASTETVHNGFGFAEYIYHHYDVLTAAGKEGFLNRLSGYLAEQKVAALLQHAGHTVQFAESATNPVWDLVVDGHLANVKNVVDTASIKAEALAHKDVLFYVPTDVHGTVGGNIIPIAGFHHDAITGTVKESIATAKGETAAHGLGMHLPWITIAFATYRNYKLVRDYDKDIGKAVQHTLIESAGRGIGVVGGAKAGALIGSVGGPIGAIAGSIIGGITGALFGGAVADHIKAMPLKKSIKTLQDALDAFGRSFETKLPQIREYIYVPLQRMKTVRQQIVQVVHERHSTAHYFFWPDFYTILLEETMPIANTSIEQEEARLQPILDIVDKANMGKNWMPLGLLMVNAPDLRTYLGYNQNMLNQILNAQQTVFSERKHLDPMFQQPQTA